MVREKKFDCVKMKRDIQEKHLREREEATPEQWRRMRTERILADRVLGPVWRRARRVHPSGLRPKT